MRVYRVPEEVPLQPTCMGLGTFDGVHLGHRAVLLRVTERAHLEGWRSMALTFDPHPLEVLAPPPEPFLLTSLEERLDLFRALGLQATLVLRFDEALRSTEPEAFVEEVLVRCVGVRAVVCGPDFTFGRNRRGNVGLLRTLGARWGFDVEVCPQVFHQGAPISSTRIRNLLRQGEVEAAAELLGRPYTVLGRIGEVFRAGSSFTAHLTVPPRRLLPASGTYEVRVHGAQDAQGMALIEGGAVLLALPQPAQGSLTVAFLRRVRHEPEAPHWVPGGAAFAPSEGAW
jgi:riboflavin kinase/FMN adenylyltransferase